MSAPYPHPLPCPRVAFEADFVAHLERFVARFAAARGRREELGSQAVAEGGHEFVGYRAYHVGDDPRRIDWSAYARLDRALVRVTRREAGARVTILIDASASMGVGPPGKLQRAAETALAIAALGLRTSARVRVVALATVDARAQSLEIDRRARLGDLIALAGALEARGRIAGSDMARALSAEHGADQVFVISDFTSCQPADVVAHASARRRLALVRILAPHELGRAREGLTEWVDPEDGARLALDVDAPTRARYEFELGRELERWRGACAAARVAHTVHSSASRFEDIAARSCEA